MTGHILFIIDGLPGGGAEMVTLRLCEGLEKRGYDITLLSLNEQCDFAIPENIEYIVSTDNYRGPFYRQLELSRRAKQMDKVLAPLFARKGQPSLILSNLHKTDRIVIRSQELAGKNVWFCIHGMFSHSYLGNKSGYKRKLKYNKIRHVYNGRNIISVSNAVGEDLEQQLDIHPAKRITIYNPFNINQLRERSQQKNPYAEMDYFLHVGRFHEVKRQDRLLEAFALADLPCKLLIAGQGSSEQTEKLKLKISTLNLNDKVELIGFIANPLPIIRGAKAVAMSSDNEGLPTVLIEALICGTPIVSTACPGGVNEIMTGELVRYKSELTSESLAEKMKLVYNEPPQINDEMIRKFDLETILDQYLSLQRS